MSSSTDLDASYVEHVAQLEQRIDADAALRRAVGGEFIAIGKLECHLLRSRGLREGQLVVDVGCGSGRLACQLARHPGINYIGCDVVPRLLDYARDLCARPDWSFLPTSGTAIPCADAVADFVCFFSVFTHLHQEEIYRYLREAHRVLKPGGLVLMSFLEFGVASHWATFIASVDGTREDQHLNQFISRDAIHAWAAPAGFDVRSLHAGDTLYIPLPEEIRYESGAVARDAGSLGQSLAVLQKRFAVTPPVPVVPRGLDEAIPSASTEIPVATPDAAQLPAPVSPAHAFINVSMRTRLAPRGSATVGFMIGGADARRVLLRAVGPTLRVFGVLHPLAEPRLELHSGERLVAATTTAWQGAADIAAAAEQAGAFPLASDSADAALVLTLAPGSHTAVVKGASPADEGEVLLEVYGLS